MPRGPSGRVTVEDVAAHAGVSVATVSRALRGMDNVAEGTRTKVLQSASQLGYRADRAAASLASGRNRSVGVVASFTGSWWVGQVLKGIEEVVSSTDHDLLVSAVPRDAALPLGHRVDALVDRVDAVLFVDVDATAAETAQARGNSQISMSIGPRLEGMDCYVLDPVAPMHATLDRLTELGHKRIALLDAVPADAPRSAMGEARVDAFRSRSGPDTSRVITVSESIDGGTTGMSRALESGQERPTAVICTSDLVAFGAMNAASAAGLDVPRDLSVVGFGGHDIGAALGVSTIVHPFEQVGVHAALRVIAALGLIDADPGPAIGGVQVLDANHPDVIAWTLVERSSMAPPGS